MTCGIRETLLQQNIPCVQWCSISVVYLFNIVAGAYIDHYFAVVLQFPWYVHLDTDGQGNYEAICMQHNA